MSIAKQIEDKLNSSLAPVSLTVVDESAQHAGHAGARPGGESHFNVTIIASAFEGQSRVARQRTVYGILAKEMAGPVHALSLTTKTPGEV
jgi:BolA protein